MSPIIPTQIFTIQASYALSVLIREIPSGCLADVIGRKKTLILGVYFIVYGSISLASILRSFQEESEGKKPTN